MVFFTRALKKTIKTPDRASPVHQQCLRILLLLGLLITPPLYAGEFSITDVHTRLKDNVYLLDAHVDYQFSDEALAALENGVPLTFLVSIEIQRTRDWWLDATVATLEQRFRLQFHPLSHQYVLQNLNSGAFYALHSLSSALEAMGTLSDFPLLDAQLITQDEHYEVLLQAELDIESLPSPLRLLAYITPSWRLNSDWYTWSLTP